MKIEVGKKTTIRGFFYIGEDEFISDYIIRYGSSVKSVKPAWLKHIVYEKNTKDAKTLWRNLISNYKIHISIRLI